MDPDNLVAIQNSFKKIRNPFKTDFFCQWNKQPVVFRYANGEWQNIIGRLADHITRHLFMKARYQYHDEQVRKLRAAGDKDGAKSFTVGRDVEDAIWYAITGEHMHTVTAEEAQQEALDITQLSHDVAKLEQAGAATGGGVFSVADVIAKANTEAIEKDQTGIAHNKGAAVVEATVPRGYENAAEATTIKDSISTQTGDAITDEINAVKGAASTLPEPTVPAPTGFGDLSQLDNNAPATA